MTTARAQGPQTRAGVLPGSLRRPTLAGLVLALAAFSASAKDLVTESRGPFLHNIQLHDAQDRVISPPAVVSDDGKPQDPKGNPYSTAQTCGKCHDYEAISQGWHFNAALDNAKPVVQGNLGF